MALTARPGRRLAGAALLACVTGPVAIAATDPATQRGLQADLGLAGPQDPKAAYRDYLAAASRGDGEAELNLAVMQDSGVGVPVDRASAATWYARAALHAQPRAAYDLALLYAEGDGVPKAPRLAEAWFREAAAMGLRAARGRRLAPISAAAPGVPVLQAPLDTTVDPDAVELVWRPASAGPPTRYWVQVVRADRPATPVAWIDTELSAALVRLPGDTRYAWRVYAASPSVSHYAVSGWRGFSTGGGGGRS